VAKPRGFLQRKERALKRPKKNGRLKANYLLLSKAREVFEKYVSRENAIFAAVNER